MDFFEAMQELKNGSLVRLKKWEKDKYLCLQETEVKIAGKIKKKYQLLDECELEIDITSIKTLLQQDWEVKKED